jgi:hypothetical protein
VPVNSVCAKTFSVGAFSVVFTALEPERETITPAWQIVAAKADTNRVKIAFFHERATFPQAKALPTALNGFFI